MNDYSKLWDYCMDHFKLKGRGSDHGHDHWRHVEKHGLELAHKTGANIDFVRLFAVLHDSCRENEMTDPKHGERAAELAKQLRGEYFQLDDKLFADLCDALIRHDNGECSDNVNIGTCWDADRLDLPRVGIPTLPSYMSTEAGRSACVVNLRQFYTKNQANQWRTTEPPKNQRRREMMEEDGFSGTGGCRSQKK